MDKSRLYYRTPYVKSFTYAVEHCEGNGKGTWLVILNQTSSYPEGGGQSYDTGTLDGVPVLSAHEGGEQMVHELAQPIGEGTLAEGIIGWQRRYNNMQLYAGEHTLPDPAHRHFGYDNAGFHMGTEEATVDFNGVIEPEELERLEDETNQLVYANVPVKVLCLTEEEPRTMEYRSKRELSGLVRIVEVPGGDVCICCGTHVENAGEVGTIKIRNMIHYKGGVRLSTLCGRRALLDYRDRLKDEIRISNLLSVKLIQVLNVVEKSKDGCQGRDFLTGKLGSSPVTLKAGQSLENTGPLIVLGKDLTPIQVHQYATLLHEENRVGVVVVCSGNDRDGEYHHALGSSRMDTCVLSEALNSRLSGRGEGSSLMVQRAFRAGREAIETAFQEKTER